MQNHSKALGIGVAVGRGAQSGDGTCKNGWEKKIIKIMEVAQTQDLQDTFSATCFFFFGWRGGLGELFFAFNYLLMFVGEKPFSYASLARERGYLP